MYLYESTDRDSTLLKENLLNRVEGNRNIFLHSVQRVFLVQKYTD